MPTEMTPRAETACNYESLKTSKMPDSERQAMHAHGAKQSQPKKSADAFHYIKEWSKNTSSFRNLLNTSKGRDKFSQLIQYVANFYITCMKDSEEFGELVRQKKEPTVLRAKKLEGNISNGRKIFRLFLWLNEITLLEEIIKNKNMPIEVKFMKTISTVCSFFYYLTDNIVWVSNMGYVDGKIFNYKWKRIKDVFSLAKTVLEVIISIYTVILNKRKERILRKKIYQYAENSVKHNTE